MEHVVPYEKLSDSDLAFQLAQNESDGDVTTVVLADGSTHRLPFRQAQLNFIMLYPYAALKIPIRVEDFMDFAIVSGDRLASYMTKIYDRMLDERPDTDYVGMVMLLWDAINNLSYYSAEFCQAYHQTVDILGLLEIVNHPEIKPIVDVQFDSSLGPHEIERQYEQLTKQLITKLSTPGLVPHNTLLNFLISGQIKAVQFPQNIMAYGPRSDIDGTVPSHVISESALSGLITPQDLAVESLAARKAQFYNKGVISESQYTARKLRMCASYTAHIYPGDCGSRMGLPIVVPRKGAENFLHNAYWDGPNKVQITKANLPNLIGSRIMLVSPITCRHIDGFCESCAGWGKNRTRKYFPPDINIGKFAATKLAAKLSQMILSSKHLSKTVAIVYVLPEGSHRWFIAAPGAIFLHPEVHDGIKKLKMRIPAEMIGVLSDLDLNVAEEAESYSNVSFVHMGDTDSETDEIAYIATETCIPYLSAAMLTHMRENKKKVKVVEDHVVISLDGFDPRQPIFQYTPMSADMLAFTAMINSFFNRKVSDYTSVSLALSDFINLLYSKADVNLFYIQILFKTFLKSPNDFRIPAVVDPEHVEFFTMQGLVQSRSSFMLLGFQDIRRYMATPSSYLNDKGPSTFDVYFGEVRDDDILAVVPDDDEDDED